MPLFSTIRSANEHSEGEPSAAPRSLQHLFEEHGRYIHSLVTHLWGPGADADDLTQEVFLTAAQRLSKGESVAFPRRWLAFIAAGHVANARRTRAVRKLFLSRHRVQEEIDRSTPERVSAEHEMARELYAILDGMSEKKRTVFIMFELQGEGCTEIAATLGCKVQAIHKLLCLARKEVIARAAERASKIRKHKNNKKQETNGVAP